MAVAARCSARRRQHRPGILLRQASPLHRRNHRQHARPRHGPRSVMVMLAIAVSLATRSDDGRQSRLLPCVFFLGNLSPVLVQASQQLRAGHRRWSDSWPGLFDILLPSLQYASTSQVYIRETPLAVAITPPTSARWSAIYVSIRSSRCWRAALVRRSGFGLICGLSGLRIWGKGMNFGCGRWHGSGLSRTESEPRPRETRPWNTGPPLPAPGTSSRATAGPIWTARFAGASGSPVDRPHSSASWPCSCDLLIAQVDTGRARIGAGSARSLRAAGLQASRVNDRTDCPLPRSASPRKRQPLTNTVR